MLATLPSIIAALSLSIYWGTVVVKLIRLSRKIGKVPNAIPRERIGRWLRVVWCPLILMWIIQLWIAAFHWEYKFSQISYLITPEMGTLWLLGSYMGAIITLVTTALTFVCWRKMGLSWRIGIDPNETTELIVSGPYRYVLHPIYSLSMFLALATLLIVPSLLMLFTVIIHCSLLYYESLREEYYLTLKHGQKYLNYKETVGRFIPKQYCKV